MLGTGYLKSKVPFEQEAQQFMEQIFEGMTYLHYHGILHRDLKLSNMFLTTNMEVKIADFALATRLNGPEEKHFTNHDVWYNKLNFTLCNLVYMAMNPREYK